MQALRASRELRAIPAAIVILGGLVSSTLLNIFLMPALYLRYGRPAQPSPDEHVSDSEMVAGA